MKLNLDYVSLLTQKKPIFFLPVEVTPRELDYKLNLARRICRKGWDVILGNPAFISDELRYTNYQGIFLEKGVSPEVDRYRFSGNIALYCLGDEGAASPAYSLDYPPTVEALNLCEKVFLWGKLQKNDLSQRLPGHALNKKYVVTGNPGFDFSCPRWRPYHLALRPKGLPSNCILINTNFASCNGFSMEETFEAVTHCSPSTRTFIEKTYETEGQRFAFFKKTLSSLFQDFPDQSFLIRPHPTEKHDNYKASFGHYPNVVISNQGTVEQAIAGSKLVLHCDCTSALQAYKMGVPVISLAHTDVPSLKRLDMIAKWALAFGALPETYSELENLVQSVLQDGVFPPDVQEKVNTKAQSMLDGMFHGNRNATLELLEHLDPAFKKIQTSFVPRPLHNQRSRVHKVKMWGRKFLPLHYKVSKVLGTVLRKISVRNVRNRLSLMEHYDPLGCSFNAKKIYPNAFHLSLKESR